MRLRVWRVGRTLKLEIPTLKATGKVSMNSSSIAQSGSPQTVSTLEVTFFIGLV